jgi:hypothetical protein
MTQFATFRRAHRDHHRSRSDHVWTTAARGRGADAGDFGVREGVNGADALRLGDCDFAEVAVDVDPSALTSSSFDPSVGTGERVGKRQRRIRARSATGQVAGVAIVPPDVRSAFGRSFMPRKPQKQRLCGNRRRLPCRRSWVRVPSAASRKAALRAAFFVDEVRSLRRRPEPATHMRSALRC